MSIRFFSRRPSSPCPGARPPLRRLETIADWTALSWDQAGFLGEPVNPAVDPYYLSFFDGDAPAAILPDGSATLDFGADLAPHFISGLRTPCVLTKPAMVASRPGGKYLTGQKRDIRLLNPYVRGSLGINPGDPDDHLQLIRAAFRVTRVWIVLGGAFPAGTPSVWPFVGETNLARFQNSAVFATSLTLKKQKELPRAELVSGALSAELAYSGRISAYGLLL